MSTDLLEQTLNSQFIADYPYQATQVLERQDESETANIIFNISISSALMVFSRLSAVYAANTVCLMSDEIVTSILNKLDANISSKIISHLPEEIREGYLSSIQADVSDDIRQILTYPEDTAGFLMDPKVLGVHEWMTVEQVLTIIDEQHRKGTRYFFLIDEDQRLKSAITIQDLALAKHDTQLCNLPQTNIVPVSVMEGKDNVVDLFEQYKMTDLPVVDVDGKLLGVIRYSKFIDAIQEDATVSLQTMVGVSKEEKALSSIPFAIKKRLPWLQINLVTAFLAAATVGLFEGTIQKYVALAVLLPVVAGQSGNTGAQALAVTMRGLALREIRVGQWKQVVFKETLVAMINGIGVAFTCSLAVALWSQSVGLTIIIFISMIISMVIAGLSGAVIPILLKKIGQDPAQSSTIILTTVTDVSGFFSFLGIATLLAKLI